MYSNTINVIYFKDDEDGSGISGTDVSGESDQENVQFDEDGNKIKKKKKKKKKGKKGTTQTFNDVKIERKTKV